jgi:hypothetical protein
MRTNVNAVYPVSADTVCQDRFTVMADGHISIFEILETMNPIHRFIVLKKPISWILGSQNRDPGHSSLKVKAPVLRQ